PTQTPTVPRPWIRRPPPTTPNRHQPAGRCHEASRPMWVGRSGLPARSPRASPGSPAEVAGLAPAVAAGASSVTLPVPGEVSDTGLDLVEGDMAQAPRCDDLLTIYHDVANGAR